MAVETVQKRRGRPPAQVKPDTPGGRLRALREAAGMSQDELGTVLGVDRTMVTRYENGKYDMGAEHLRKAADHFSVTPSFILFDEPVVFAERTAPLVGIVGAGDPIEALEMDNPVPISVPSDFEGTLAFRVKGTSCLPIFEPDDLLIVQGGAEVPESAFLNRYCVVQTVDGIGYVKKVTLGEAILGEGRLYTLVSENFDPIPGQRLAWARPVLMRIIKGPARSPMSRTGGS